MDFVEQISGEKLNPAEKLLCNTIFAATVILSPVVALNLVWEFFSWVGRKSRAARERPLTLEERVAALRREMNEQLVVVSRLPLSAEELEIANSQVHRRFLRKISELMQE